MAANVRLRPTRDPWYDVLRADVCAYCGQPGGTIDHIVPRSQGGSACDENLTGACARCNSAKGSLSLLWFVGGFHLPTYQHPPPRLRRAPRAPRAYRPEGVAPSFRWTLAGPLARALHLDG